MCFIGIDLGTSFIKGAVLDLDALRIEHIHRIAFPEPLAGLPELYREFDPNRVLAAARAVLDDLRPYATRCEGLVMCSQMHGLVFTTDEGEPRSNLTTWQDQRVLAPHPSGRGTYFEVMKALLTAEQLRRLGNELRPGLPVGNLFWLAQRGELPGGRLVAASLPDFVLANLCGAVPTIESTNAMAHGVLDLVTLDWHRDVIAALDLGDVRWPEIVSHGSVVGRLAWDGRDVPCYTPVGDFQCALTGALLGYGELSLNISTGSQVSLLKPGLEFGDYQTRPFFDRRYLNTITHIPAGRSLNALVRLLAELAAAHELDLPDPWPYISEVAATAGRGEMVVDLAFFNSSCGDHGAITQIREADLTVGHLFRAAFENMTHNYARCARRLSPSGEWQNLVFSGGLAQKIDILRELICAEFQVPYRMCPTSEDTMLGLLALALAFTGRTRSVGEATGLLLERYGRAEEARAA